MSTPAEPILGPSHDFAEIRGLAVAPMQRVDALIRQRLSSDVVLINQIADHIIASGGKAVFAARKAGVLAGIDGVRLAVLAMDPGASIELKLAR